MASNRWHMAFLSHLLLTLGLFNEIVNVSANYEIIPHWEANSTSNSCLLKAHEEFNATVLTSDSAVTCVVQVKTSSTSGIVLYISQVMALDSFIYITKQGNIVHENRYVVIEGKASCFTPIINEYIQVSMQGNVSVFIAEAPTQISFLSQDNTSLCITTEFNHTISCSTFSDNSCSFEFLSDCFCSLGNGYVEFQCQADDSSHTALIVYPNNIITLDLSNQNVNNLAGDAFVTLHQLEILDIGHNRLSGLKSQSFSTLPLLKELYLDDNILTEIESHVFDDLVNLTLLDLGENDLVILQPTLLMNLSNLETLSLKKNQIASLDKNIFRSNNKLVDLDLSYNKITDLPIGLFDSLANLQSLTLDENKCISLSEDIFNALKQLNFLALHNNILNVLPLTLLRGLVNLDKLVLSDNHLSSLNEGMFNDTTNLTYLTLSGNKLISLPEDIFSNIKKLNYLSLRSNNLKVLDMGLFKGLTSLEELRIYDNQLEVLDKDIFNETTSLTYLSVKDNQLASLHGNIFANVNKLNYLQLHRNNLWALPRDIFKGLANLEKVKMGGNPFTSMDRKLFSDNKNLKYLSTSWSKIQFLPRTLFNNLHDLEFLYLHENELESIERNLFQNLHNLEVLFLNRNRLKQIPFDTFWSLHNVHALALNYNNLNRLDHRTFRGMNNLRILFLGSNQFSVLSNNIFKDTSNLLFFDMSLNHFLSIPNIDALNQLDFLNLRENKLTMVDKVSFTHLPKQVYLVVSQTEVCECYVSGDIECSALDVRSPYLTCDRLLSSRILMIMMWIIGINALGGNLLALRQQITSNDKNNNTIYVQSFLLSNLAISDLIMGIYMLLIACADIYFGENFPMQAESWRSGITCRVAGSLSIISSEASIFFVTLISIDRLIHVRYPLSSRQLRKRSSALIVAILWLISLALGIVPSVLAGSNFKFYDNSHVCIGLPLAQIERFTKNATEETVTSETHGYTYPRYSVQSESLGQVPGLYYAVAVFLGLNGICYLIILLCYAEIVRCVLNSSKRVGLDKDMKEQLRLTGKVAAIVLTDFFCWAPVVVLGIFVQAGLLTLPPSVFAWSVTVILPINSAINPYLYTIAAVVSDWRRRRSQYGTSG